MDLTVFDVRTWDIEDYFIIMMTYAHVCAHAARVTAHARSGEQDTGGYVPAVGIISVLECETAAQGYRS